MAGLIEEGKKTMEQDAEPAVLDAALIAAAQKVEHYEIASYGCVCTYAEMLGHDQVHELLGQNLDEEETTDQRLTALAETVINPEAEEEASRAKRKRLPASLRRRSASGRHSARDFTSPAGGGCEADRHFLRNPAQGVAGGGR